MLEAAHLNQMRAVGDSHAADCDLTDSVINPQLHLYITGAIDGTCN
jgi:hypothetical protein